MMIDVNLLYIIKVRKFVILAINNLIICPYNLKRLNKCKR